MILWMLLSKTYISKYHRNQVNAPLNVRLATSLINFECQLCGILENIKQYQDVKSIAPSTFSAYTGLGDIIKGLLINRRWSNN